MAKRVTKALTCIVICIGLLFLMPGLVLATQPHKTTVSDYLNFEATVKELMIRAKALPVTSAQYYLTENLTKMQKTPNQYGIFNFEVHIDAEKNKEWVDLYYGATNKRAAFRIRNIEVDKYGQINWIEEMPENKRLPRE